ncbi:MAG: hypothetical protein IJJ41_01515 [Clostridia bacterium]|nr:hypothetical protein [Clostridia bacterium]
MICNNCKKENSKEAVVCAFCGKTIGSSSEKNTAETAKIEDITSSLNQCFERIQNSKTAEKIKEESSSAIDKAKEAGERLQNSRIGIKTKKSTASAFEKTKGSMDKAIDKIQDSTGYGAHNRVAEDGSLLTLNFISHYNGKKVIGIAESTGKLKVFSDRIEYKRQLGNAIAGVAGLAAVVMAKKTAAKKGVMIFAMDQIKNVYEATYGGVWTAFIIEMKYGEVHTFSNSIDRAGMKKCIKIINQYKK